MITVPTLKRIKPQSVKAKVESTLKAHNKRRGAIDKRLIFEAGQLHQWLSEINKLETIKSRGKLTVAQQERLEGFERMARAGLKDYYAQLAKLT